MKKFAQAAVMVAVFSFPTLGWAAGGYWANMLHDDVRGVKNVLSSPLEIPITVGEYDQKPGRPFVRQMAGAADGIVQMAARAGSGLWDFLAALVPGNQEGLPVEPETLF